MMVDIKNYEGLYAITEDGRVWSYRNKKFLKLQKGKTGYYKVVLSKNNIQKTYNIHKLVAIAYIDNPNDYPCINHKDENKLNNKVENLEWCTYQYNSNYGTSKDRIRQKRVGCVFSQETLQKMSDAKKGKSLKIETKEKIGKANKGRIKSEETKQKMSQSKCKKIMCIETKIIYNSIKEAGEALNLNFRNISACCIGKRSKCGGFHWKFI